MGAARGRRGQGARRSRTIRISAATSWSRSASWAAAASASPSTPATPSLSARRRSTSRGGSHPMSATFTSRTTACSSPTRATGWCAARSATARCRSRELAAILAEHHDELTAVLEPGALEARHVRLSHRRLVERLSRRRRRASSRPACAPRSVNRLADDADYRTPWEREDDDALVSYELDMIRRSAANMKAFGIMQWRRSA